MVKFARGRLALRSESTLDYEPAVWAVHHSSLLEIRNVLSHDLLLLLLLFDAELGHFDLLLQRYQHLECSWIWI